MRIFLIVSVKMRGQDGGGGEPGKQEVGFVGLMVSV